MFWSLLHCVSTLTPAVKPGVYEEVQQGQTTVLKMNNKEIPVTR